MQVLLSNASPGIALSDLIRRDRLSVGDVLRLFQQVCDGLAAAHRMGIVHGDITPEAILVTPGGTAKLRGFALGATGYSADCIEHNVTGAPEFMAPEVCRGQHPSSLSDVYSVGAVLVTILTGEVPFPARTALEYIHLHITAPVPDLAVSHPEFAALAPVIRRMMAKEPAPRWIGMEDLARELLVLSGQIPKELRCRAPSDQRQQPLSSLVQSALASVSGMPETAERSGPSSSATATGSTTTISRKSTEFFRNPDLFKPTGLTPSGGLPVLSDSSSAQPTTRAVRSVATAKNLRPAASTGDAAPDSTAPSSSPRAAPLPTPRGMPTHEAS